MVIWVLFNSSNFMETVNNTPWIDFDKPPMETEDFFSSLVKNNGFKRIAPHIVFYDDPEGVDMITVSVMPGVVVITADGKNHIPSFDLIQIRSTARPRYFWEGVLQDVLAHF